MHPLKTIVTAASAFAAAVNAVAIPTVDVAVSPAIDDEPPLTPGEVEAILEKRDNAMFTIGYALCSYTVFGPVPTGWSTEKHFFWPGQYDVGCVEHDKSPQNIYNSDGHVDYFKDNVCNVPVNFYLKNGNYDFYRVDNSALMGTCYPYKGPLRACPNIGFGSCAVRARWRCYYSFNANVQRIC